MGLDIRNSYNQRIDACFLQPENADTLVVFFHGLGRDKDYPLIERLSNKATENNIASVRFDFTGHGKSDGDFYHSLVSQFIDDSLSVIDYSIKEFGYKRILLIGVSLGGMVAMNVGAQLQERHDIKLLGIGLQSPVSYPPPVPSEFIPDAVSRGYIIWDPGARPRKLRVDLYHDVDKHNCYNLPLFTPLCIVHGDKDSVVPLEQSQGLQARFRNTELFTISNGDHNLEDKVEHAVFYLEEFIKKQASYRYEHSDILMEKRAEM